MVLESFFDWVFGPLLNFPPVVLVVVVTIVMLLIITLIQKFTSNQKEMKLLKEQQKDFQKSMKENKGNTEKVMEIQKQAMDVNMRYFKHSMKPMLFTFLPIILIFGWMNSVMMYDTIKPDQEFNFTAMFSDSASGQVQLTNYEGLTLLSDVNQSITKQGKENLAAWKLKGPAGNYVLGLEYKDVPYEKSVVISDKNTEKEPIKPVKGEDLKALRIDYPKLIVLEIPLLKWKLGWLGTYIIFSLILSGLVRKVLKVY